MTAALQQESQHHQGGSEVAAYQKLSDYELIVQCQDGLHPKKLLFAELVHRYQPYVEKVLYHLAPQWSDRADLAQEVWIRVYRRIKRLREPIKFRGWLSRIISNLFYDELRKRKRSKTISSLDLTFETPTPTERLLSEEFYDQFRSAVSNLPEAFRVTILMREIEDLSYEEIAEITGVSLGTVKSRVFRARRCLQGQLLSYLNE